ncbi:MAG: efflux RND transporter periplasmic adaptor subunit [Synergistaceae bacterium]|nr:efflux RND transporter periplasmic adaptor subunit [Synergistaceae bacterium]
MIAGLKKLIILALLAAIGWGIWYYFVREEPVVYSLTVSQVTRGDILATVTATGELNAINVVDIGTQVSGTIQEIYVDYNTVVKKGQLLAVIDPSVLKLTLSEAEASLAVYQAGVRSAQANLEDAERQYKRSKELFNRKLIARSEVDTNETTLATKRAALAEARARAQQGKASVERARTNLNYTRITSPIDGIVVDRKVDVGQTVAASYQTPELFSIAQDLTKMQIETKVDEADIGNVKEGQTVTFRVDAFPDEIFNGKVVQVRISPSTTDSVVTYTVIINVDNKDFKLKPGMTANVSIETAKAENALRIPVAALRFTPPEALLQTISVDQQVISQRQTLHTGLVWIGEGTRLFRAVPVDIGVSDNRWVELKGVRESSRITPAGGGRRPKRPEPTPEQRAEIASRPIIGEGTPLVINAKLGADGSSSGSGRPAGLMGMGGGAPRGGGRGGPR